MFEIMRLARPDDRPRIEAIVRAAYAAYVPLIGREPAPMGADYAALIDAGHVHVAGSGGVMRGVLVVVPEPDALLLENVAVSPESQGSGLGTMLLEFAECCARAAGYTTIRLYTNVVMVENIARYARRGYVETHRDGDAATGFQRVYMTKTLV